MTTQSRLWAFSLNIYGMTGVADACLALQNTYGLDVNLLLYCCWAGDVGVKLKTADVADALDVVSPWSREIVRPLREARTWMKTERSIRAVVAVDEFTTLRETIKAIELDAERLQQHALESMTRVPVAKTADAGSRLRLMQQNLDRYFKAVDSSIDDSARRHVETLLGAAAVAQQAGAVGQQPTLA